MGDVDGGTPWYLIGFRNKLIISIGWMWNYLTYDRGARAIIHPSASGGESLLRKRPAASPNAAHDGEQSGLHLPAYEMPARMVVYQDDVARALPQGKV